MQVKKQKFKCKNERQTAQDVLAEALAFAQQKLGEGYGNIRIITAKSVLAKRYLIQNDEVQVRYW